MSNKKILGIVLILAVCIYIGVSQFRSQTKSHANIIIFSPHPDDASLCCGGLIQQSRALGNIVHIVNVTDGEGYKEAAAALAHKPITSLTPEDMLALGHRRQDEELHAMNILGVPSSFITFLGYPDGWLDEVYKNEGPKPFTNPFTYLSRTQNTNRVFTRVSVVSDIASLISRIKPTQIIVPALTDSALDHVVTNIFVSEAMRLTNYSGTLVRYIIHTKNDATQSANPTFTVPLTDQQIQKKNEAIEAYTSQTAVDNEYLHSLTKNVELFY